MQFVIIGLDGTDEGAIGRRLKVRQQHIDLGEELRQSGNMWYGAALLADDQYRLIAKLGKQSGFKKDKLKNLPIGDYKGFSYLVDVCPIFELKIIQRIPTGDHELLICETLSANNLSEKKPLQLDDVYERKLIL